MTDPITSHLHAARVLVAQLSMSIDAMKNAALTSAVGEAPGEKPAAARRVAAGMFGDAHDYLTDTLDVLERAAKLAASHTAKQ